MGKVTKKQVCKCHNCGNEAEMQITCELPKPATSEDPPERVKGTATCSHCGNEADMWIDV